MTAKGIDCSVPLSADKTRAVANAGYGFVARYLVPQAYAWKRLTRAEAEAITAAGMQIVSVFETTANRPAGGTKNGYVDGAAAYREALAIGQPAGSAIYFAVDYDAGLSDFDAIAAYLQAAATQLPGYRVGVYGSYAVVEAMIARGAAQCAWQTYAWSRGRRSAVANIWQHLNGQTVAGHSVDLNESYGNEGWWNTTQAEVKKKMSEEDALKIIGFLQAAYKSTTDPEAQAEFHRLANEVRKAAGLPTT